MIQIFQSNLRSQKNVGNDYHVNIMRKSSADLPLSLDKMRSRISKDRSLHTYIYINYVVKLLSSKSANSIYRKAILVNNSIWPVCDPLTFVSNWFQYNATLYDILSKRSSRYTRGCKNKCSCRHNANSTIIFLIKHFAWFIRLWYLFKQKS